MILALTFFFPLLISASDVALPWFFLETNRTRYTAYQAGNPGLPFEKVLAFVNVRVDKGFYNDIVTVDDPDSISVLVNKNFALPQGYVPSDLVSVGGNHRLRAEVAEQLEKMRAEMNSLGFRIFVVSTYRTHQSQANRHSNAARSFGIESADRQYARAGHSEHQTGLAVDLLQRTNVRNMSQARFQDTAEFAWLTENAHRYGFILRYPNEYRDIHGFIFEPWHWRYVGVDIATAMYDEGIALFEEYYGKHLVF